MIRWVKGLYKDGVVTLAEPIEGMEECDVVVIFPDGDKRLLDPVTPEDWEYFHQTLREAHERHLMS